MSQTQETISLITGGSRGLGRSMAEHLGRAGADVIITWRARQEEADAVVRTVEAAGRRAVALQLDAGDIATFPAFAERLAETLDHRWGRKTLGRPGRVSDIGPIVAALVSADNRWINGQRIEASGGMRL